MKIGAINSASYNRGCNVQFNSRNSERENRSAQSNSIRNTFVMVPLATLLAMSPLNSSSAERNSVFNDIDDIEMVDQANQNKRYSIARSGNKHGVAASVLENGVSVNLECKSEKADGKFQKAILSSSSWDDDGEDLNANVQGIRKIKYNIVGDDGIKYGSVNLDQLVLENEEMGCSSPAMLEFCNDVIKGNVSGVKNDGAIKVLEPIELNVYPSGDGAALSNKKFDIGDWLALGRNTKEEKSFGTKILSKNVNTSFGKYTISAYSNDNNPKNFETITVQKDGEGEFKVARLVNGQLTFKDNSDIKKVDLNVILLRQRNGHRPSGIGGARNLNLARIMDQELFGALKELTGDARFNEACSTGSYSYESKVYTDGTLRSAQSKK